MTLKILENYFTICKLKDLSEVPFEDACCFIGKTEEEISLVCDTVSTPKHCLEQDSGWRAFRIQGVLDFSLIGILSGISTVLADHKIGIFVVSTYNTDYILVKEKNLVSAKEALEAGGYEFEP